MRFAVFAAVSSEQQAADDKDSIPNQITACRALGTQAGGVEVAVYVADGYSRSYYDGLTEAMANIPPLKEAMEAAARHDYDVLICYYYERFGDIAKNVLTRLSRLKIQFVSVNEPVPIVPPDLYDPARDQTRAVLVAMSDVKQNYRISRIVNNFRDAIPRRIKDGLTPSRIPYGYRLVNSKTPPEQNAEECAKLLQAKQMLFEGATYQAIGEHLGVYHSGVVEVLSNPYYCGQIFHNRTTKNGGKLIDNPRHKWISGEGKHVPLWTVDEYQAILSEIDRRREMLRNSSVRYIFSGLLRCAVCGANVRRDQYGPDRHPVVHCKTHGAKHVSYRYEVFYPLAVKAIQDEMRKVQSGEVDTDEADKSDVINRAIDEKKKKRRKIQEGYEAELYSSIEASKLLKELDKETEQLDRDLERITRTKQEKRAASDTMEQLMEEIEFLPIWMERIDPKVGNRLLAAWLKELQVSKDGVKVVRR